MCVREREREREREKTPSHDSVATSTPRIHFNFSGQRSRLHDC